MSRENHNDKRALDLQIHPLCKESISFSRIFLQKIHKPSDNSRILSCPTIEKTLTTLNCAQTLSFYNYAGVTDETY
ncbi:hypothetical protein CSB45_11365 [candidate division KSB3 bacterium]|uniref:Uncharacterized protein n=1 Tax=candidate division KSB3 bacterium TaxID=2044937 RepID=A0A2G6E2Z7_9BACT|nr:MAG: hypothetical protein CSB45_11365 [candidate division KSB3 bacterium]PIE28911.1 MAG: hypothetical protein CSA57_11415 [candidate division KSB3 bacterium]